MDASRRWNLVLAAIAMVLGILVSQQMRLVAVLNNTTRVQQGKILTYLVTRTIEENQALNRQVADLSSQLSGLAPPPLSPLKRHLAQAERMAGLTPVSGPGVVVKIHDATGASFPGEPAIYELVHDQYVLHIVGVLSAAGATAISIDGQRYVSTTSIFCAGPTIRINGINYGSPYVIEAVGPPLAMLAALNKDPDVQGWSQLVSIQYGMRPQLKVLGYQLPVHFSQAEPAKI